MAQSTWIVFFVVMLYAFNVIEAVLHRSSASRQANPTVTGDRLPTTAASDDDAGTPFTCQGSPDGYYADPNTCRMYYICNNEVASHLPCGPGLYFDPLSSICNYPENVQCNAPNARLFCDARADGLYADPVDCSRFYQCASGLTYPMSCNSGLLWNTHSNTGDWPDNVNCNRPFSCLYRGHGYYRDPYDCSGFYHCAAGKTYWHSCGDLYWNEQIGGCDYQCIPA